MFSCDCVLVAHNFYQSSKEKLLAFTFENTNTRGCGLYNTGMLFAPVTRLNYGGNFTESECVRISITRGSLQELKRKMASAVKERGLE